MSTMTQSGAKVQATIVLTDQTAGQSTNSIYRQSFEEETSSSNSDETCFWEHILESMHVAFLQQEVLDFEHEGFDDETLDEAETHKGYSNDGDNNNQD
jgi:hypothetical protein